MGVLSRLTALLRGGSAIALAMAIMNIGTYGFNLVVAHLVGPTAYGAFGAVMNLLLVASVASLGLQATAARRISAAPEHVGQIEDAIMRVTYRAALAAGLLLLVAAPLIDRLLRLDSLAMAIVVALAAVPLTVMGGQAGTLQGERRWTALGWLYVAAGVPRLVIGTALVLWRPTEFWAVVAVALGFVAPVVVGWWALRHERRPGELSAEHRGMSILKESVHNSQALFAYFALSNVDLVVARHTLPDHDSGLYAAGLILTKAMLFLPQFVVVVAFPDMATARDRRRALIRSLGLIALLGVTGSLAAWLLSDVAMVFVGGGQYVEIRDRLWVFAVLGTLLSMVQLLVYSVLARQGRRSVWFVWTALVALVAAGLTTSSLEGLVAMVLVVDVALLVVLLAISARFLREPDGARESADAST